MSEHYIHIPSPMEVSPVYRQALERLVEGLNHGTPSWEDGKILAVTANLEPQMRQDLLQRFQQRGWSVTVSEYYGTLHWRFKAA